MRRRNRVGHSCWGSSSSSARSLLVPVALWVLARNASANELRSAALIVDALGFLSQHLVVLLDPNDIVSDMHEAYRRVRLHETAYGCFMAGPSATADIEATLVHGAQGARSLDVFFLPRA